MFSILLWCCICYELATLFSTATYHECCHVLENRVFAKWGVVQSPTLQRLLICLVSLPLLMALERSKISKIHLCYGVIILNSIYITTQTGLSFLIGLVFKEVWYDTIFPIRFTSHKSWIIPTYVYHQVQWYGVSWGDFNDWMHWYLLFSHLQFLQKK